MQQKSYDEDWLVQGALYVVVALPSQDYLVKVDRLYAASDGRLLHRTYFQARFKLVARP